MKEEKLERCGFCGSYFKGLEYLTADELKAIPQEELDKVELGYCPNAGYEDPNYQEPFNPTIQEMAEQGVIGLDSNGNPM